MALIGRVFHGFSKNWKLGSYSEIGVRNWGQMRELGSEKLGSDTNFLWKLVSDPNFSDPNSRI